MSSEAVCEGSVVDVSRVDNWAGIEGLLRTAVRYSESGQTEVEPPRITVSRRDGSEFTFVAPVGQDTMASLSWMHDTCKRLRKSEGRILVPGPIYGVWSTGYDYDEFHERGLRGTVRALTNVGDNVVRMGCGVNVAVVHRTEACLSGLAETRFTEGCRVYARIDGDPAVEAKAWCDPLLCYVREDYRSDGVIVPAMQLGKRARIRVSGARGARRRDFDLSLWGLGSAHDWVMEKCASLSEQQ